MVTTNFIDGVTNVADTTALGSYFSPDPTKAHAWFDDFDRFNATATGVADWQANLTGVTPTFLVTDADGGQLLVSTTAGATDAAFFQWKGQNATTDVAETFRWASDKRMWFKARFKVSDATLSDVVMGLQITDTTPLDVTDGLFFIKATGQTGITFRAEKTNTASTVTTGTMANDTYVTVGYAWDPKSSTLNVYFNDVRVGSLTSTTNFPDTEDLAVSFGIQNGAAAIKTMTVDYIFAAKER